jgi:hypothetical protein
MHKYLAPEQRLANPYTPEMAQKFATESSISNWTRDLVSAKATAVGFVINKIDSRMVERDRNMGQEGEEEAEPEMEVTKIQQLSPQNRMKVLAKITSFTYKTKVAPFIITQLYPGFPSNYNFITDTSGFLKVKDNQKHMREFIAANEGLTLATFGYTDKQFCEDLKALSSTIGVTVTLVPKTGDRIIQIDDPEAKKNQQVHDEAEMRKQMGKAGMKYTSRYKDYGNAPIMTKLRDFKNWSMKNPLTQLGGYKMRGDLGASVTAKAPARWVQTLLPGAGGESSASSQSSSSFVPGYTLPPGFRARMGGV